MRGLPQFPADAFAGTADYYVRYRVPYPSTLLNDLISRAGITGSGTLLDLACGPGRVCLRLAKSFARVCAIDLEQEMIEAGRKEAARLHIENIDWIVGRAEDLHACAGAFELITIGAAFHRLDQQRIALQALGWLEPGGHIATLGELFGILHGDEPWQRVVAHVAERWTGRAYESALVSPEASGAGGPPQYERVLHEAGFESFRSYPITERHEWTIDEIIGNLFSLSVCSKNILGANADAFAADVRTALLAHDPHGRYVERAAFGYTIAQKPF